MKTTYLSAVAVAATLFSGAASAVAIDVQFNLAATGPVVADTAAVSAASFVSAGAPVIVGFVQVSNVGTISSPVTLAPDPLGVTVGSRFTKTFQATLNGVVRTFTEQLLVTARNPTNNALGVLASGTITCGGVAVCGFEDSNVFWSAAYTQNSGPGTQINGSYNNSTRAPTPPPPVPEPGTLALLGLGLLGLGAARRRKA